MSSYCLRTIQVKSELKGTGFYSIRVALGSCTLTLVQEAWGLGTSATKVTGLRESP